MKISIQKQEIQKNLQGKQYKVAVQKINKNIITNQLQDDLNFPSELNSIGTDIRTDLNIDWRHIQQLCKQPNYSQNIEDIKTSEYCNKSITNCLLLMNWFASNKFLAVFSDRVVSKGRHYEFTAMVEGVIYKIFVNSKIALKDGKILFAEIVGNSIFPSIFEKVIAKIYGNYETISDSLLELLQIWTGYALQSFSNQRYSPTQFVSFFQSALNNKSLPFFRTRNSVRLQGAGLTSNTAYSIVRVIQIGNLKIIQFMVLNGQIWKGKHSKTSQFWKNKKKQMEQYQITLQGLLQYIEINDLIGISRQFVILHNTQNFNTNWIKSSTPKQKHIFSLSVSFYSAFSQNTYSSSHKVNSQNVLISLHFMKKMCRNSTYIICQETCQIISCSFKEKRDNNFMAASLEIGKKYLLYVYAEDIQGKGVDVNVTVNSEKVWCQIKQIEKSIFIQQRSLLHFMQSIPSICTELDSFDKKSTIKIKNLYNQLGQGFLSTILQPSYKKKVTIFINKQKLKQIGIQIINCSDKQITYISPCHSILIFKFKSKFTYKQGDPFPPEGCISVVISQNL